MNLVSIYPIINELQSIGSSTRKIEILLSNSNNEDLKKFFFYSLDSSTMFNITSPIHYEHSGGNVSISEQLLSQLINRSVTGNAARELVNSTAVGLTSEAQDLFIRMINKDPRCGVSDGIVNKVWKGLISSFKIMKGDSVDNLDPSILIGMQADAKIDGHRCLAFKTGNEVQFLSSNGKPMYNMEDAVADILRIPMECCILDGEHFDTDWNQSSSLSSSSKTKKSSDTWTYKVWDILTPEQYSGKDPVPYIKRLEYLDYLFEKELLKDRVQKVKTYGIIQSVEHFNDLCDQSISEGFEGLMVKNPLYVWEKRRSRHWIKYKPTQTFDYQIIGILPGDPGKKHENSLGRFLLKGIDGTTFHCGNGFSDQQREEFWRRRGELINSYCEVREDNVTDRSKMVTRFPRFVRLRPDKSTE